MNSKNLKVILRRASVACIGHESLLQRHISGEFELQRSQIDKNLWNFKDAITTASLDGESTSTKFVILKKQIKFRYNRS